ncbi:MAG: OmpA family protein [Bacteroidaceae bacterium]|nr:OmpA family protein [Bacteroidaceae bacterium]MBR4931062.1 OmpA family protein [Bacteroidaceae bacterium]
MNFKKTLLTVLVAMGCSAAMAQQTNTETVFNPHWYVRGQIGGQYTLGEVKFGDLVSPNAQIAAGYNFTSLWGARIAVNAWQSKGGSKINGTKYDWKYNYVAPMVDATLNLTNLFGGFKANRLVDLTLFAGIGANIGFNNDEAWTANGDILAQQFPTYGGDYMQYLWDGSKALFVGRAGIDVDFNVCERVAIGLELSANTLSDKYNSKKAGNSDWYFNGLIGAKVNLGKTTKQKTVPAKVQIVEKIVEKPVEKVVEKIVYRDRIVEKKAEPLRREIFFTIRATQIVKEEMAKVEEIANYLKANPNAKVVITGHADKGTGNTAINKNLSEKRAKIVADTLVKKFGIAESRISYEAKGDSEQPFAENDKNRVSICIAK